MPGLSSSSPCLDGGRRCPAAVFLRDGGTHGSFAPPPLPPDSALAEALNPDRGNVSLGDDPRGTGLVEVTQLWADSLLNVRHYVRRGRAVTVSDQPPPRRTGLSALIIGLWVLGAATLGVRHATLAPPPELSAEDESLLALWEEANDAERAAAASPPAEAEEDDKEEVDPLEDLTDPLADLAEATRDLWARDLARERRAMEAGRTERRLLQMPPFHLDEQPDWHGFVRDELLPAARDRARAGALPDSWRRVLETVPAAPDLLDDPDVARVAEDLPTGTVVRRSPDNGEAWTVTSGLDPEVVTLAHRDGRREALPPRASLWPFHPDAEAKVAQHALAHEIAGVLYTDALARRSARGTCAAVERLLGFPAEQDRAELHARAGACHLNQGDPEAARASLAQADGPLDLTVDPDAATVLLRARARLARSDLDVAIAGDLRGARVAARDEARTTLVALRTHVVDSLRRPSDLRAVARELQRVEQDAVHQRQEDLARGAGVLGLLILLLLPLALVLEERRARATGSDFFVDGEDLALTPWTLVRRSGEQPVVCVPGGAAAELHRGQEVRPITGEVPLDVGDRVVAHIGGSTFVVQEVCTPRGVASDAPEMDWGYLSVLAALLLLSAAFTVVLATADPAPATSVTALDDTLVRIALTQPEPPEPAVELPREEPDAGEGTRSPGPEGQRGTKEAKLNKARGMRVAVKRDQHNQQLVRTKGLLGAIERLEGGIFGDAGLSPEVSTAAGGLIGTQYGDQRGEGGALRGDGGGGGCMSEVCGPVNLSGLGIRGVREGRIGDGRRPGDLGPRGNTSPTVGAKDPIVLGSIDKATVARIVAQHLPAIRYCYESQLGRNPSLRGKVSVKFVIAKDGSVATSSSRADTLKDSTVTDCVHERFRRMRFPEPRGGGIVSVSYPLVFDAR